MEGVMQCAAHPSVETELACGRCGKPICPRCLVQTPVGARCRECAGVRRLPTYHIPATFLLRGLGAALMAGAVLGLLWRLLFPSGFGFFYGFLVALGLGYVVGESVSLATNRKSGPPLQVVAAAGVVVAYLVRNLLSGEGVIPTNDLFGYIVVGVGVAVAIGRLR
jgi:hypothetical protein